jgi:hypothetical protein
MPSDQHMHDFYNRTPGTLYGEYGAVVADGKAYAGQQLPRPGVGGGSRTSVRRAGSVQLIIIWSVLAGLLGMAFSGQYGLPHAPGQAALIVGGGVAICLTALAYFPHWVLLPVLVAVVFFVFKASALAATGFGALVVGVMLPSWAPVALLSRRVRWVGKVAKIIRIVSWIIIVALAGVLIYGASL